MSFHVPTLHPKLEIVSLISDKEERLVYIMLRMYEMEKENS